MDQATIDDRELYMSAEAKILAALRSGETLSVDQIVARFDVSRASVKVMIANIRKNRLNANERIPPSKTGAHVIGKYHLEIIE